MFIFGTKSAIWGIFKKFGRFFKIKVKIIKGYLDGWKLRWLLTLNVYDLPKDLMTSINFGIFFAKLMNKANLEARSSPFRPPDGGVSNYRQGRSH